MEEKNCFEHSGIKARLEFIEKEVNMIKEDLRGEIKELKNVMITLLISIISAIIIDVILRII